MLGVFRDKLDGSDGDLGTAVSGVIKTAAVMAAVRNLVVILSLVVEGITNITALFLSPYTGPIFAQLLAVDPLTALGEMVVRATQSTLKLPLATRLVGAVLLAVRTLCTEVAEGGAVVALVPPSERVPGIAPVGLAVRAVLHQVSCLPALLTPPAFSRYRGGALGLHWK